MPSNLDDKEDKNGQLFIYAYLVVKRENSILG